MPRINSNNARYYTSLKGEPMRGKYIVAYKLIRKNAKRHECFRADTIAECANWIARHTYTDRYFIIYDYKWRPVIDIPIINTKGDIDE